MFVSRKQQEKAATEEVENVLVEALSHLASLLTDYPGCAVVGLSVSPGRQGDGYLAVLRVELNEDAYGTETFPVDSAGAYVIYGFGTDVLNAIANVEAQLKLGTASLAKDRYAKKRS